MAIHRLTLIGIENARKAVRKSPNPKRKILSDGNGLYVVVEPSGSAAYLLNVQVNGRRRYVGLGGIDDIKLADVRIAAAEARVRLKAGIDVVAERKAEKVDTMTFEQAALAVHEENRRAWKNAKRIDQWLNAGNTIMAVSGALRGEN